MNPLETYLHDLREIHDPGVAVPETSYYPALSSLLNAVGKQLTPRVRCIVHIQNQGAGIPDGGLFSADQFQRGAGGAPLPGQLPSRGVIEAKGANKAVSSVVTTRQVRDYAERYGQVLVTNYREFVLVEPDGTDGIAVRESYLLAASEAALWATEPRELAATHTEPFIEYLKRVMLRPARLTMPKDVAWFLASYARDARVRLERQADLPALAQVRSSLEDALGIKFEGERGEHFLESSKKSGVSHESRRYMAWAG